MLQLRGAKNTQNLASNAENQADVAQTTVSATEEVKEAEISENVEGGNKNAEQQHQDDFLNKFQDIENAVCLTLRRATALEKLYQTQIEEKDVIDYDTEDKLKMLIYNICREMKQIFVIFFSSPEFIAVQEGQDENLHSSWFIIRQLGKDFLAMKDDEMAFYNIPSS